MIDNKYERGCRRPERRRDDYGDRGRHRDEGSGGDGGGGGGGCCLKFWLAVFILATLALIAVVLWLVLAPRYATPNNGSAANGKNGNFSESFYQLF